MNHTQIQNHNSSAAAGFTGACVRSHKEENEASTVIQQTSNLLKKIQTCQYGRNIIKTITAVHVKTLLLMKFEDIWV